MHSIRSAFFGAVCVFSAVTSAIADESEPDQRALLTCGEMQANMTDRVMAVSLDQDPELKYLSPLSSDDELSFDLRLKALKIDMSKIVKDIICDHPERLALAREIIAGSRPVEDFVRAVPVHEYGVHFDDDFLQRDTALEVIQNTDFTFSQSQLREVERLVFQRDTDKILREIWVYDFVAAALNRNIEGATALYEEYYKLLWNVIHEVKDKSRERGPEPRIIDGRAPA